jgi:hypothetical protein
MLIGGINSIRGACDALFDRKLIYRNSYSIVFNAPETRLELRSEKFALFALEMISTPATRDAIIGDLIEARDKIKDLHGERKARFYFWWQVSRTIGHFAWAWVRRLRWIAVALGFHGMDGAEAQQLSGSMQSGSSYFGLLTFGETGNSCISPSRSAGRATSPWSSQPANPD